MACSLFLMALLFLALTLSPGGHTTEPPRKPLQCHLCYPDKNGVCNPETKKITGCRFPEGCEIYFKHDAVTGVVTIAQQSCGGRIMKCTETPLYGTTIRCVCDEDLCNETPKTAIDSLDRTGKNSTVIPIIPIRKKKPVVQGTQRTPGSGVIIKAKPSTIVAVAFVAAMFPL